MKLSRTYVYTTCAPRVDHGILITEGPRESELEGGEGAVEPVMFISI